MVLDEFRARVAEAPDAVAVQDGNLRLTYRSLAAHASGLATKLTERGVGRGSVVAVYANRSAELVVAELAALLAGAAYLPLDPAHPPARIRQLLELSGATAVLSTEPLVSGGAPLGDDVLVVDLTEEPPPDATILEPPRQNGAALAYVIYTSGSTGQPKGVAVTHASLANLMRWHHRTYGTRREDRSTLLCSPGFDVSVQDIWFTLTAGATLVVPPAEVRSSPPALATWLADEQLTVTFLPTPLAEAILDEEWPAHTVLRFLHTGGSAMQRGVPDGLTFPVINLYGPTEATVKVTAGEVVPGGPVPPPIGVPVDGVRCYVLDGLDPVPDGDAGELCLAGECVARGYLNDPASTAASFVPDIGAPGQRMYRTGDMVRRRPDGVFEYIGRYDDQAKIRGFRIEPGEVATVLKQHPAVRDAFVVAERSGRPDARLVAYVVSSVAPAELTEFVAVRLPPYMVPAAIVELPELPLTPNGKVDRAALPAPDRAAAGLADVAAPPRTPAETALAGIVAGLLGDAEVGAHDDFFALGGNSLLVARLAGHIAAELQVAVSVSELFTTRTVAGLAAIIDQRAAATEGNGHEPVSVAVAPIAPPVRRFDRDRPIPLSLPQERVWFFEQLSPGNLAYNFQATVSLHGQVDVDALRAVLDEIVSRHEILRTAFVAVDGVGHQRPMAEATASLRVLDVPAEDADEVIAAELREPFDLTKPPLARWVLLRHEHEQNTFLHVEHHFVHDGWSLSVFLSELRTLYPAFAAGQPSPLPELAVQYADYAYWQRDWMRGEVLRAHVDHWTARLSGAPDTLELPTDRPRPPVMTFRGAAPRIRIPAELSRALRSFSREHHVSLFTTMYAGFAALLHRYTGQQDMLVGTGAANRNVQELEPLLGMLVNTLVLRTKVSADQLFSDLLEQVRDTVTETLAWSDTPVDAVIDAIDPSRDPSRTPLFQVMFSFHDSAVPDIDFGGLTGQVTERSNRSAKSDLNVIVIPRAEQRLGRASSADDDDLAMIWEHSTDLFDESTMSRMVSHYLTLLADAVELAVTAARTAGDQAGQAAGHLSLATLHWVRGHYDRNVKNNTTALALARATGWADGESAALGNLGTISMVMGQLDKAVDHYTQAVAIDRRTGWLPGLVAKMGKLGLVYAALGRLELATEQLNQAAALNRQTGSRGGEARVLFSYLGKACYLLGRFDDARATLTRALAIYRAVGDRYTEAESLRVLAAARAAVGHHDEALELADAALALAREIGDPRIEVDALTTAADIHRRLGNHQQAVDGHTHALLLARDLGYRSAEIDAHLGLAADQYTDQPGKATESATDALALTCRFGYRLNEAKSLALLAAIRLHDDPGRAVEHAEQAVAIYAECRHRLGEAHAHLVAERAHRAAGDESAARLHQDQASALSTENGGLIAIHWSDSLRTNRRVRGPK